MSAILDIDDVPHIIRYGMHSDKAGAEECWIQFYRSGVMFIIDVSQEKVKGTPFAEDWIPLLDESAGSGLWESLCTLVITTSLGTIRRLVVGENGTENHERWKFLEGYLNTISYRLEVVAFNSVQQIADANTSQPTGVHKGVTARILSGPELKPSYEFCSFPIEQVEGIHNMGDAFDQLVRYRARDLEVFDASNDWRVPPSKVRSLNGDIFYFVACEETAIDMDTEKPSNSSLDSINAYCKVHRRFGGTASSNAASESGPATHIPRLHGIVLTSVPAEGEEQLAVRQKDGTATDGNNGQGTQTRVAGLLVDFLHHAQPLSDCLVEHGATSHQMKQKWKAQIGRAVEQLHSLHITIGGDLPEAEDEVGQTIETEPFYYLNEHTVLIASNSSGGDHAVLDAWLTLNAGCTHHEDGDDKGYEEGRAMDIKALDQIFGSGAQEHGTTTGPSSHD